MLVLNGVNVYSNGFKTVKGGDHILGIFHKEDEPEYALDFLKSGFEKNEAVLYITDYLSKDEIRNKIRMKWKVKNLKALEDESSVLLFNTDELIPTGGSGFWKKIAEDSITNGKSGVRIFVDVAGFIKKGFSKNVLEFEKTLENEFDFPCTLICAYTTENMKNLSTSEKEMLMDHHKRLWV